MINFIVAEVSSSEVLRSQVLEIAVVVVDRKFNICQISPVLTSHRDIDLPMDADRYAQYSQNGLLDECASTVRRQHNIDDLLLEWLGHSNTMTRWPTVFGSALERSVVRVLLPGFFKKMATTDIVSADINTTKYIVPARALERVLYNISCLKLLYNQQLTSDQTCVQPVGSVLR